MPSPVKQPLHGIIPPIVTPLSGQDQLDVSGTQQLLNHIVGGGVHGIFALGTTGEGTSLSNPCKAQFVELACEVVAGRVPVLVGITDTVMSDALELASQSHAAGATAVVTAAPYYLPMTQDDLLDHTRRLADALPLPLIIYNMPSCTKTAYSVETVRQLAQHENIVGVKDTSGDLDYYAQVAEAVQPSDEFTLLVGPEELLLESLKRGGKGGVNGGANMFPALYAATYEAYQAGQMDRAEQLQNTILKVAGSLYQVSDSGARVIQGIKTALSELGICSGVMAEPFRTYQERERAVIRAAIAELEPQIQQLCPQPS